MSCQLSRTPFPPAGDPDVPCCIGSSEYGPAGCTCWEPEFEVEQQTPDPQLVAWLRAGIQPVTRRLMCADCAYRPESPEKTGTPGYAADADELERIAAADRFWCHQGLRRPVRWVHPRGDEIPGSDGDYSYAPIIDAVPYRADGTPAELCAGWDARRRALMTAAARDDEQERATP